MNIGVTGWLCQCLVNSFKRLMHDAKMSFIILETQAQLPSNFVVSVLQCIVFLVFTFSFCNVHSIFTFNI